MPHYKHRDELADIPVTLDELVELRSHFSPRQFTNHVWVASRLDAVLSRFDPADVQRARDKRA